MGMKSSTTYIGNKKVFADNLTYYIEKKGVMQKDVAEAIKIANSSVTDWIKGRSYPRMDKLQMLAEYFGVEILDLIEPRNINPDKNINQQAIEVAQDLLDNPESLNLYLTIKELTPENRALAQTLLENLKGGTK
jgi:repressor LexA